MKATPPKNRPHRPHGPPARPSTDWLSGHHSVYEALRAGRRRIDRLLIRDSGLRDDREQVVELARAAGVPIESVDEKTLDRVCGPDVRSQGVALAVGPLPELSLAELIGMAAPSESGPSVVSGRRILVLDGVEDPQNVGAVARVADSAGCAGMVLTDRRAPGLTAAVSRASAGAIEWLPVARVTNLVRALEELKSQRFWILAAAFDGSESLFSLSDRVLTGDLVVVLGAEGKGIRPGVLEQADHRIRIPMRGAVASLNVATAGAVILYDLLRRAEAGGANPAGIT